MMEVVNRVQRAERDLTAELGRMPSPEEVALRSSLTVEKLLDIMQLAIPTTSLDAPVGYNTDDLTVGDTIADTDENDPISSTERSQLREASREHSKTCQSVNKKLWRCVLVSVSLTVFIRLKKSPKK